MKTTVALIALILGLICIFWMHVQTKKYQTNDKYIWLILAFFIPIPTVFIFYFTQMSNKTMK
ncbi:hypothetical protein [Pedobacter sp. Hv1]|uniref:hypothetical protein n=1 Tax=Pedobacter sp. Hv1 TaxID=1740090 RepID=UPI0006D8B2BF|nr:hypothetical protein [Pedobacter sp. Hv1]KQC01520.1 hypothetical protein AQF98_07385 [Pedobacter sp. Hv1]